MLVVKYIKKVSPYFSGMKKELIDKASSKIEDLLGSIDIDA